MNAEIFDLCAYTKAAKDLLNGTRTFCKSPLVRDVLNHDVFYMYIDSAQTYNAGEANYRTLMEEVKASEYSEEDRALLSKYLMVGTSEIRKLIHTRFGDPTLIDHLSVKSEGEFLSTVSEKPVMDFAIRSNLIDILNKHYDDILLLNDYIAEHSTEEGRFYPYTSAYGSTNGRHLTYPMSVSAAMHVSIERLVHALREESEDFDLIRHIRNTGGLVNNGGNGGEHIIRNNKGLPHTITILESCERIVVPKHKRIAAIRLVIREAGTHLGLYLEIEPYASIAIGGRVVRMMVRIE